MTNKITKAIIPVAGYGTRRLPITKAIEKCMMPIGNIPVIDFIVKDCLLAGINDIYFVVGSDAQQLEKYYSRDKKLENYLTKNHKEQYVPLITPPKVNFHYIVQSFSNGQYGTTVPVWLCKNFIDKDEQVLVIMGDQFFYREDGGSNAADLIKSVADNNLRSGLLGVPVPYEDVDKYGIIEKDEKDNYVRIIEKPKIEDAPSNLNNASFYLFDAKMFDYLDQDMKLQHKGEYMITDPINRYVEDGNQIKVIEAKGQYLDAGNVKGWLHANNIVCGQSK